MDKVQLAGHWLLACSLAALAALGATIWLLVAHSKSNTQILGALLGLAAIAFSWAMLHLMYGARYAHIYYSGNGDLDFHQDAKPTFVDFFYFSFATHCCRTYLARLSWRR